MKNPRLARVRVYRGLWRFEDRSSIPVIRIATPRGHVALDYRSARKVVHMVHDLCDELERDYPDLETHP